MPSVKLKAQRLVDHNKGHVLKISFLYDIFCLYACSCHVLPTFSLATVVALLHTRPRLQDV